MREESDRRSLLLETGILAGLALLVRLANLDHTAYVDELNHLIAAESLLRDGALLLESGVEYTRARFFTWLVAGSLLLFGEGLVSARIPAVLAGTLLVVVTFLWVRRSLGAWEGWTAGILVLLAPQAIYHSQIARFYSFQALFVLGAAWCAWTLATRSRWSVRGVGVPLALGALCGVGAMAVQISSLLGLAAIGLWLAVVLAIRLLRGELSPRFRIRVVGALVVGVVVGTAWVVWSGTLAQALASFGHVGLWAESQAGNLRYYHYHLLSHYPVLWAAFPVIVLLALRRHPGLSSLWVTILGLVLVVHSLAAWKADRYIFYALPFFFALVGMVVGALLRRIHQEFRDEIHHRFSLTTPSRTATAGAGVVLAFCLFFAAWANPAFPYSARMILGTDASWHFPVMYRGEADWRATGEALGETLEQAEVVITSTEQKARYFLGRGEVILSRNYLGEDGSGTPNPQFHRNDKTDVPVISEWESLEGIVACHRTGLVLVERNHWRQRWSVPDALADRIETLLDRVHLDDGWRIHGFEWDHGADFAPERARCPDYTEPISHLEGYRGR